MGVWTLSFPEPPQRSWGGWPRQHPSRKPRSQSSGPRFQSQGYFLTLPLWAGTYYTFLNSKSREVGRAPTPIKGEGQLGIAPIQNSPKAERYVEGIVCKPHPCRDGPGPETIALSSDLPALAPGFLACEKVR